MIDKILSRTSIRDYSNKKIENEKINKIKEVINSSPTSCNGHQFSAIFITDKKTKEFLYKKNWNQKHILEAPLFILFLADLNRIDLALKESNNNIDSQPMDIESLLYGAVDATIAAQMAHDAALEMDLSCCYIGGVRAFAQDLMDYLNIKGIATPIVGLTVGYSIKENPIKPKMNKVFNEKYDLEELKNILYEYNDISKEYYKNRENKKEHDYIKNVSYFYSLCGTNSEKQNNHYHSIFKKLK